MEIIEFFKIGGYPLLCIMLMVAAIIGIWKDRQQIVKELIELNRLQHKAELDILEKLTIIEMKIKE